MFGKHNERAAQTMCIQTNRIAISVCMCNMTNERIVFKCIASIVWIQTNQIKYCPKIEIEYNAEVWLLWNERKQLIVLVIFIWLPGVHRHNSLLDLFCITSDKAFTLRYSSARYENQRNTKLPAIARPVNLACKILSTTHKSLLPLQ